MKDNLNILLLGRGGRESALADKLLQSPRTSILHTAPGKHPGAINAPLNPLDFDAVADYAEANMIDLVVIGPEAPIVGGLGDILRERGIKAIAPDIECAKLEGSKEFAKEFMTMNAIPTPRFMTVTADTLDEGIRFLDSQPGPYVVKANGLAAGRGVVITPSLDEAKMTLKDMLEGLFNESSETVVLEEYKDGKEYSVFLAVDGEDYIMLPTARDYKRLGEGDTDVNTAGVGAVSSPEFEDEDFMKMIEKTIIIPTIRGLKAEGMDYNGFLYLGLIYSDGLPMLLEYNVRLGDPETQAIMPRIESDIVDILEGLADRTLALKKIKINNNLSTSAVVLTADGYPGPTKKGGVVSGLDDKPEHCILYPGSVKYGADGVPVVDGGRIATVVGTGDSLKEASDRAQKAAETINFEGKKYRSDINGL